jgi:hypothetical protein
MCIGPLAFLVPFTMLLVTCDNQMQIHHYQMEHDGNDGNLPPWSERALPAQHRHPSRQIKAQVQAKSFLRVLLVGLYRVGELQLEYVSVEMVTIAQLTCVAVVKWCVHRHK